MSYKLLAFERNALLGDTKIGINFGCDTMPGPPFFLLLNLHTLLFCKQPQHFRLQLVSFRSAIRRRHDTRERFLDSIRRVERLFCFYPALDALLTCHKAVFILLLFDDGGSLTHIMEGL